MSTLQRPFLALVCLFFPLLFPVSAGAAAPYTCDPGSGIPTIGLEYYAVRSPCASDDTHITYIISALSCSGGVVTRYADYGDIYTTPRQMRTVNLTPVYGATYRYFESTAGAVSAFYLVHKNYTGVFNSGKRTTINTAETVVEPNGTTSLRQAYELGPVAPAGQVRPVDYPTGVFSGSPMSDTFVPNTTYPPLSCTVTEPEQKNTQDCSNGSNPIHGATGMKTQVETDYSDASGSLVVQRYYRHEVDASPLFSGGWGFVHHRRIKIDALPLNAAVMTLDREDGRRWYARTSNITAASPVWTLDADLNVRIQGNTTTGWQIINEQEETEDYGLGGSIRSLKTRSGQVSRFVRSATTVTQSNSFGKSLVFTISADNAVLSVKTPDDLVISYGYEPSSRLMNKVTYPGGKFRQYTYENGRLRTLLDEELQTFGRWQYDALGRGIAAEHGSAGANKYTFDYTTDATLVTVPGGAQRRHEYTDKLGRNLCTGITQGTDSWSSTVDSHGNPQQTIDFNGNRTTYVYNTARNLESSRTEGVDTPQQRTINTQWHPVFRLPVVITESGRTTEMSYDSKGNMTLRKVIDTTLPTPVTRSTTYTYVYHTAPDNPYVTRLAVDGPRTDIDDRVVYDYDSQGQLLSMTQNVQRYTGGPVSTLITRYGDYDVNGRVGLITAPNTVKTRLTYWPRGWLKTRVLGEGLPTAQTTAFDYYANGLLKKVTRPDASWIEYVYDDAHRLTDIRDQAGNFIHYTLDSAGNRTKEEVNDISGALAAALQQIKLAQADSRLPSTGEAL